MALTKMQIMDFQGLEGKQEFTFDKITALCQENGKGKTSLLNALRYGLTGAEPKGEMVTTGKERAAVQLDFASGKSYLRIKYAQKGKSAEAFLNRARVSQKNLNEEIMQEFGHTPLATAKIISSAELLEGLNTQQFGEVLLQYLPEQMNIEEVLERYPEATEKEREIIRKNLPEGQFTSDALDQFHALLVDRRRLLKRTIAEQEAVINNYGAIPDPQMSEEEIKEKHAELMALRDQAVLYDTKYKEYQRSLEQKAAHEKKLEEINKDIDAFFVTWHTGEEMTLIDENIQTNQKAMMDAHAAAQSLATHGKMLRKALETLNQSDCPLSEKIVCTTDKSGVQTELEESLKKAEEDYVKQSTAYEDAKVKDAELQARKAQMIKNNEAARRKGLLETQKEELIKNAPEVLPEPEKVAGIETLNEAIQEYNEISTQVLAYNDKIEKEKRLEENRHKLVDYENLVASFSPRGKVKEAITSHYLDDFAAQCNEKAGKIFPGMKVKFVPDRGVDVLVDVRGTDEYRSMDSLSGGEKATTLFLLLNMLSNLSGFGILLLDELSILDKQVFRALVEVIVEHQDEYHLCLIATVSYEEIAEILADNKIPVMTLTPTEDDFTEASLLDSDK